MPRYNVPYKGKWGCFSTIVDAFITDFMQIEQYEEWRSLEYGSSKVPLAQANRMRIEDAALAMCMNKEPDAVRKEAGRLGIEIHIIEEALANG